ncbi:hypothetical protein Tco_0199432 [Tanacetum coccineum]
MYCSYVSSSDKSKLIASVWHWNLGLSNPHRVLSSGCRILFLDHARVSCIWDKFLSLYKVLGERLREEQCGKGSKDVMGRNGLEVRNIVISDSEDSTVTYTVVSSPFEGLSDIGSLGVNGPPMMLEDQYAYVAPLSPEFVPEPVYSEFMPPEDEVFPTKEQPLHAVRPPSASSLRYIANSDPAEDEEDHEEDPIDYPVDGGDDDDDDDESSDDDKDDDDDDVEEDEG